MLELDGADPLALDAAVVALLRERLPRVATRTVAAVVAEVAMYAEALTGQMGMKITQSVELALDTFLRLVERGDTGGALGTALDGAYALGRGEARSGRNIDGLLNAYRVGARVAWHEWGSTAVESDVAPGTLVLFAERVFAYIDQLSAASVTGHGDEMALTGRVREQYLERLGRALLAGAPFDELAALADGADWEPPGTLTAVLITSERARWLAGAMDRRTLTLAEDVLDANELPNGTWVLLVPDTGAARSALWRTLVGEPAVVGPAKPWTQVYRSYARAVRVLDVHGTRPGGLDTEELLTDLVVTADPEALADLRSKALAPLADLPPATADRLAETLRSWLLHQGRRDDVARHLTVHPQTVRYRMSQVRELYGDTLLNPQAVLELTLALAGGPSPAGGTPPAATAP